MSTRTVAGKSTEPIRSGFANRLPQQLCLYVTKELLCFLTFSSREVIQSLAYSIVLVGLFSKADTGQTNTTRHVSSIGLK